MQSNLLIKYCTTGTSTTSSTFTVRNSCTVQIQSTTKARSPVTDSQNPAIPYSTCNPSNIYPALYNLHPKESSLCLLFAPKIIKENTLWGEVISLVGRYIFGRKIYLWHRSNGSSGCTGQYIFTPKTFEYLHNKDISSLL
jgi:hypothetical protein